MPLSQDWVTRIQRYTEEYNIPIDYLADTLYEPKVIPMIRGKAFEFSAMIALRSILPHDVWEVGKNPMNAQQGIHDIDVSVKHKPTQRMVRVECKLAKKESFRMRANGMITFDVKCMRSRTLGTAMVQALAPVWERTIEELTVHNDQYLPTDFDVVVTSLGNAFYRTNPAGIFEWQPTGDEVEFLRYLKGDGTDLKNFAFNQLYIARSVDLTISTSTGIPCGRRACRNRTNCNFIPNYPIIQFTSRSKKPSNGWIPLEDSESLFDSFMQQPSAAPLLAA